jgi:hypothetical protein
MAIAWVECWKCELCGHRWIKTGDAPRLCSKCKKTGWNMLAGEVIDKSRRSSINDAPMGTVVKSTSEDKEPQPAPTYVSDLRSICSGNIPNPEYVETCLVSDVLPECCECGRKLVGKEIKGRGVVWACAKQGCPMYGLEQKPR